MSLEMPMNPQRSESGLSMLDGLICLFLALPLLLFCAWFKWPFAIGFGLLTVLGLHQLLQGSGRAHFEVRPRLLLAIVVVSAIWTALAGVGLAATGAWAAAARRRTPLHHRSRAASMAR